MPLGDQDHPPARFGCDAEIDITELPHAFRTVLGTIPAAIPYLSVEAERSEEAARRLSAASGRLRVGLVWAAGAWKTGALGSARPACAAQQKFPVSRSSICSAARNIEAGARSPAALPMIEVFDSDDIADTAATIANLDLVITVDTMVAHLAGALGAPVWLMLHFAADWRWLLDRSDSPWYPTMRLFRQKRPGDWDTVIAEISTVLRQASS